MAPLAYIILSIFFASVPSIHAQQCVQPPLRCVEATFKPLVPSGSSVIAHEVTGGAGANGQYGEPRGANLGYPQNATNLPRLCAVTIRTPSVRFGLFLPPSCTWNGKLLAVGNGAQAGGINWPDMGQGPHYNMATISTDTGHNSEGADLRWGLNNPEALKDWGYRAVSGSVQLGKKVVEGYYNKSVNYSYWSGCSTGGRQGLKAIQTNPELFDGVLVGAPAWDTKRLFPWITRLAFINRPGTAGFVADVHLNWLKENVWKQCIQEREEVRTGRQADPFEGCRLDWNRITCEPSGNPDNPGQCLTGPQVETMRQGYAEWRNQTLIFPGMPLGSEPFWTTWFVLGPNSGFSEAYEKYWLYNDESWSLADWDEQKVLADSERINPGNATANQFDVSAFRNRNGKVLMYHGTVDAIVPTGSSQVYYDETVKKMGTVDDFMRLLYVPGMYHCWFTDTTVNAPWAMGGAGQAVQLLQQARFGQGWSVPGFEGNARYDALVALMNWVEKKQPVESLIATTWEGVRVKQRPICKWPAKPTYNEGPGGVNNVTNWNCR